MTRSMFLLYAVGYYVLTIIIIVIVLTIISKKTKKKYRTQIDELEREKNLIISASILSELNKVEALVNNEELKKTYDGWKKRFEDIKNIEIPKITDCINEIQVNFEEKNYKELKTSLIKADMDLNYVKNKADYLLEEIKEITLSEERNREKITKLKIQYREILTTYHDNNSDYERVRKPLELQFENVDKLFSNFEEAMDKNAYTEVGKIVKAIDNIISNLKVVIEDTKTICEYGEILIPKKIENIAQINKRMTQDGYNLEYLNIGYNIDETNKKIVDIFQRLNVLDVEDSIFELKTMLDYFDSLYLDFDKEKEARKLFEEYSKKIILKIGSLEKVNNELYKKLGDYRYSYDLTDEDVAIITDIKDELEDIRNTYDKIINSYRSKILAYTKLAREMELLNAREVAVEKNLTATINTFNSLKDNETRAQEQLVELQDYLNISKNKVKEYKLPVIPKNYSVELAEACEAIEVMINELNQKPISIKTLNMRVSTARDLVLKVYQTIKDTIQTAKMAEMAIVYGNRFRVTNKDVDLGLMKAEASFNKGNYKLSLEQSINTLNIVEPGIYDKLLESCK